VLRILVVIDIGEGGGRVQIGCRQWASG